MLHCTEEEWARFASKTAIQGECIVWKRCVNEYGYGRWWFRGRAWYVHRWAYWAITGELVPELDHTCRVRTCVVHLQPCEHRDNLKRRQYRRSYGT